MSNWWLEAASGAAYGASAVALAHPLDTLKTRQQAHRAYNACSSTAAVRVALRPESGGALGLLRGLGPALGASMLFRALPFAAYGWTTGRLRDAWPVASSDHPLVVAAIAGASGGALRSLAECPLEAWKVRAQVGGSLEWRSAYVGLPITALRNASVIAIFFTLFQATADARRRYCTRPWLASFVGGAGCSTAAWLVVFPLDVIKSRCQGGGAHAQPGTALAQSHVRAADAARAIVAEHGVRGLYKGLGAGLARSVVANGGAMVVYDATRTWLGAAGEGRRR